MEFSYIIGITMVLQLIALKINRFIGSIIGGVMTTFVLFYGFYLYWTHDTVVLWGEFNLSMTYFFLFIFLWYTLDILKFGWELSKRISQQKEMVQPAK